MQIRKAARQYRHLKIGIGGISGSGKTLGALRLAYGICKDWNKICGIDTENKSMDLYAHLGPFNKIDLDECSPQNYIAAIAAAVDAGNEVVVIDSLSHEWVGKGGLLEQVEQITQTSRSGNSYTAWGKATPMHNQFMDAWLGAKCHIIATMRKKADYVIEQNDKGKSAPRKVGFKNIQRDGTSYEFDLMLDIHSNHLCTVDKDRTMLFDGQPAFELTEDIGLKLLAWAASGEIQKELPQPRKVEQTATTAPPVNNTNVYTGTTEQQNKIKTVLERQRIDEKYWDTIHEALIGKTSADLQNIVKQVMNAENTSPA